MDPDPAAVPRLGGLLLAGGHSARFGSDKALAEVDGDTLLDRGVACLRAACDGPVVIASGDGRARAGVGDRQVADLVPDAGPLSAIGAGLRDLQAEADLVAVLAVDHLAPSAPLLELLAATPGAWSCAVARVGDRLQPLHAVWSTAIADDVVGAVEQGERSVVAWLAAREDVVVVEEAELRAAGVSRTATRDVDVPGDLRR